MENTKPTTSLKSVYKFGKLDSYTFYFFTFQYLLVVAFHFYFNLNYAAWSSMPVFILFTYFSFTKKYSFYLKTVTVISAIMLFYSFIYILYGKSFNFLVLNYLTAIVYLIMFRFKKLMISTITITVLTVLLINYFDFFEYDFGNKIYFKQDVYTIWFYFVVIMISLYLIIFLTSRNNLVTHIIKDLKEKNQELEESRVELKKLQLNKESFFAIMSHEIRTPLNAIKGISDILKSKNENAEKSNLLELMDYSANHLLALVNNILDFTKLNDGVFSLNYTDFNIRKSFNSLFKMNERLALEKGLALEIIISKNIPQYVYGDKNRINQIVLNLLNNSIEHTANGHVKMEVLGKYNPVKENEFLLEIIISDTGKGIEKKIADKLFQKYASSNSSKNSVGLGLTISKGLVELMNGEITFTTKQNIGTTFFITLPLAIPIHNIDNVEIIKGTDLDHALKILLVDDNKINLLVLEKQLKNKLENSQLTTAKNGLEAINLIKDNYFDIILMDVIMPVMDGITATKLVRNLPDENKKNTPIIALTANVGEKEMAECLQVGMNDFVTKPFEINAIVKVIFEHCNIKKRKRVKTNGGDS